MDAFAFRPSITHQQNESKIYSSQDIRIIALAYARWMERQEPLHILVGRPHEVQPCFQSVLEQN